MEFYEKENPCQKNYMMNEHHCVHAFSISDKDLKTVRLVLFIIWFGRIAPSIEKLKVAVSVKVVLFHEQKHENQ